jgi:hypothetical protein
MSEIPQDPVSPKRRRVAYRLKRILGFTVEPRLTPSSPRPLHISPVEQRAWDMLDRRAMPHEIQPSGSVSTGPDDTDLHPDFIVPFWVDPIEYAKKENIDPAIDDLERRITEALFIDPVRAIKTASYAEILRFTQDMEDANPNALPADPTVSQDPDNEF